ncbi:MAG: gliding motility-associated-like protein, partial [Flavobacteriales bacterium]
SSTATSPTYQWTGPSTSSSTNTLSITGATTLEQGIYSVSVTENGCTSASATINITINPLPTVSIPGTGDVCVGSTISLTPSTGGTWSSSNTAVATITNAGVATGVTSSTADMVFTNSTTGCSSLAANGSITVNALPVFSLGQDTIICPGASVNLNVPIGNTVLWSTTETSDVITVTPTVTATYSVTITDGNQCSAMDDILISVNMGSSLDAMDDVYIVDSEEETNLDILNNDTYSNVTTSIVSNPINGLVLVEGDGSVSYTSNTGYVGSESFVYQICDVTCTNICETATVSLTVDPVIEIVYPNIVSPNGDGYNDVLYFMGLEYYPENAITIFNRWGEQIYTAQPYMNDWDGLNGSTGTKIQGDKLSDDTYFYIIQLSPEAEPNKNFFELITE